MIPYLVPYLISVAISAGIGAYAWRRRTLAGASPFAVVALAEVSWTLGYVCELVSGGLGAKVFWDNVQWIGAFAWPMAFLALALQYTGRWWPHRRRTWGLLAIVPAVFLLLVFTNRFHGWVRPGAWLVPGEPFAGLVYDFTAVQVFAGLYGYALVLYGIWVFIDYAIRSPRFYRAQVALIVLGMLIPVGGTVLTLAGITFTVHRDTTPFTFAAGNLIIAWGLFRYRLFDIAPVARDAVVESMGDAVIVLDARNRVVGLNPVAQELIDQPASGAIGKPADDVLSAWPDLVECYRDITTGRADIAAHVRGERRSLDLRISPLYDRRHRLTGRLLVMRDVTERKRIESQRDTNLEALQKERDFIAAVLDTAGALVVVLDPQGRIVRFNRACERLTGYSFEQARDKYLWDFLLPEEMEAVRATFEELQAGRFPNEHENYWVGKDESRRLIAWSNTVLLDDEGAVEYVIGIGIDVEKERRREQEATVLAEITKLVSGTLRLEEVLDRTAEYARELFQADHCGIALYSETRGTLRYVVVKGGPSELVDLKEIEIRPTKVFRETVLEALQPLIVENAISDPAVGPQLMEFVALLEIQSFMTLPIKVGGRPLGFMVLTIRRGRQRRFTAEDTELALAMANQAAMAIDNARLYEAEQRRAEQFRLIGEVGRRITSILDIDALLKEIARLVKNALGYYLVGIALVEGDELVFKEGAGGVWEVPEFQAPRLKVGQEGITGWVAQHGEPLLVPDVSEEPRYYSLPLASEVRSELAVPLKAQDAIVGVLHAQSDRLDAFDESDLDVLQSLAHQAAIAIENARLYASVQQELAARTQAERALHKAHDELERRVEDRTAELRRANISLEAEVVERTRVETALRKQVQWNVKLLDTTMDGFVLFNLDGTIVDVNPAFCEMIGRSRRELVGMNMVESGMLTAQEHKGRVERLLSQGADRSETKTRHKDGHIIDVDVSDTLVQSENTSQIAAFVRDITGRKQTENALRESEERYRTLFQSANDAIFVMRRDRFLECNRATEAMFGCSHDDIIGSFPYHFSPTRQPDGRDSREKAMNKIYAALDGTPQFFEWVHCRLDGTLFDAEVSLNRMSLGGEWLLLAMVRDVTKRKRAEKARRRYAERLEILHEIDQGILATRSPETIAQVSVTHIRQLVPCSRAGVVLFDFAVNEAVVLAVDVNGETRFGQGTRYQIEPFEDKVELLRQGRVVTWKANQSRGKNILATVAAEGLRSAVSVPLIAQGELIGLLNLDFETSEPRFTQEHDVIAREVADQLAIAIQQARLHEQIQSHAKELEQRVADRTRELSVLYEVAALASQSPDLERTLARSLEHVLEAMGSDAGLIHLLDETDVSSLDGASGGEALHLIVQQGLPPDLVAEIESMPSHEGLGGWIVGHDEPLIVPDVISDPRLTVTPPTARSRAYAGMPLRAGGRTLGVLSIVRGTDQPQLNLEEISLLTSVADQLGSVVESARLRGRAERAAVLEERGRLARDLHDSVVQLLYSANLFARSGQNALHTGDLDKLGHCLVRLGESAQQALREMRLLVYELRPLVLEREGLAGALQQRLDAVEGRVGVATQFSTDEMIALPAQMEGELYRIAVEALNNALKHASATSVTVRLNADPERIQLQVTDNGSGFDPGVVEGKGGLGLVGMRERAEMLGGMLTVTSAPGRGTAVKVTVPHTA